MLRHSYARLPDCTRTFYGGDKIKIYIAGKWEERRRIARYARTLIQKGHTITWPWYSKEPKNASASSCALKDVEGVRKADTCIFVFDKPLPYKGAYSELGMALALRKRVLIVGKDGDSCVFVHYPTNEHVRNIREAYRCLAV